MAEPVFAARDAELRALQADRTRLVAERDSYKRSAEQWHPGWKMVATAFIAGISATIYAFTR